MKKILVPVLALLLLIGGGGGAYFYMGKSSEAAVGDAPAKEAKKEEGEGGKSTYLAMDTIILPIIGRDGISQTVSMVVSLEFKDAAKTEEIKESLPKLADAFLSDMYGTLSQKASMEGGVIKVSMLKSRLMAITNKVMGEGVIAGVLLQVLQQHPS